MFTLVFYQIKTARFLSSNTQSSIILCVLFVAVYLCLRRHSFRKKLILIDFFVLGLAKIFIVVENVQNMSWKLNR